MPRKLSTQAEWLQPENNKRTGPEAGVCLASSKESKDELPQGKQNKQSKLGVEAQSKEVSDLAGAQYSGINL